MAAIPFVIHLRNTYSNVWVRFGALTKPRKAQDCPLYITSTPTALFATCKELVMKTYHFVSFDNGFMQFSTITVEHYVSAEVAHYMLTMEYPAMWVSLTREDYLQLRNG